MNGDIFESFFGSGPEYHRPGTRILWRKGKTWQTGTIIPTPPNAVTGGYWIETADGKRVFATPKNVKEAD